MALEYLHIFFKNQKGLIYSQFIKPFQTEPG
jgi:hypothetical protein